MCFAEKRSVKARKNGQDVSSLWRKFLRTLADVEDRLDGALESRHSKEALEKKSAPRRAVRNGLVRECAICATYTIDGYGTPHSRRRHTVGSVSWITRTR